MGRQFKYKSAGEGVNLDGVWQRYPHPTTYIPGEGVFLDPISFAALINEQ